MAATRSRLGFRLSSAAFKSASGSDVDVGQFGLPAWGVTRYPYGDLLTLFGDTRAFTLH